MSTTPNRVLLKLSGESLTVPGQFGICPDELAFIAGEIAQAHSTGAQIAIVVGGGNIIRGAQLAATGHIDQSTADYMGMLGTVINALALKEALGARGLQARVQSAISLPAVAEPFIRARAIRHLEKGRVVILSAGTGNPFFTTDTCAALRGIELGASILLKATKVDGIYDQDPRKHPAAKRFDRLTFGEALKRQLGVMDLTAMTMCMEHKLPVVVFDYKTPGNIAKAVSGGSIGTRVSA
ncbi:MAG: UMP kinase [Planctomycetota bacterium]|nr:UMP kinase [Planctomycetota bacterium]MDA1105288.1 UMP kinase [Planctomycetota bacterium]